MSKAGIGLGKRGEDIAVQYLQGKGFKILTRNYRQKSGEIDIICKDHDIYVFVEVKTRSTVAFGHPLEAITRHKQHQISVTALNYLSRHNLLDEPARFDVVGVICSHPDPDISHIVNAFDPC